MDFLKELTKDNVKVELEYIGEGYSGDYDPEDEEDKKLLRFTVLKRDGQHWLQMDNGSYCTLLTTDLTDQEQKKALNLIMDKVYNKIQSEDSIKRICEELSWLDKEKLKN